MYKNCDFKVSKCLCHFDVSRVPEDKADKRRKELELKSD